MSYSIIWSPIARDSYLNILEYLQKEWSSKEIETFTTHTNQVLNLINKNPSLYQYSAESDTHRCILEKQVSLYYRVKGQNVELLVFWDNRQDPEKLNLKE